MLIRPSDSIAVSPVSKISAALPVVAIGDTSQELESRANQFSIGNDYLGRVLSRTDSETVRVRIEDNIFKMKLGQEVSPGQTLTLKFLHQQPNPTFLFSNTQPQSPSSDKAQVSSTGYLIDHYLQEAGNKALSQYSHTNALLSMTPSNAFLLTNDLKQAVSMSGLFYESHLADFAEGKRSLTLMMQEPQNRLNFDPSTIVAKQLDIFENNKFQWNGQVWPDQTMQWTISQSSPQKLVNYQDSSASAVEEYSQNITSELKLELPNLGKVAARLQMQNGRLRIQIEAEDVDVAQYLKQQSAVLATAIDQHGSKLDQLLVKQHEYSV